MSDSISSAIVSSSVISAGVTGGFIWLFKNLISEHMRNSIKYEYDAKLEAIKSDLKANVDKDIEAYKAKLNAENTISIEKLKSSLQLAASEHNIRFTTQHNKVAAVIEELYSLLNQQHDAIQSHVSPIADTHEAASQDRRQKIVELMKKIREFFATNQLYLNKPLSKKIKSFTDKLQYAAVNYLVNVENRSFRDGSKLENWHKILKSMQEEIPQLLEDIADEFRKILGVY